MRAQSPETKLRHAKQESKVLRMLYADVSAELKARRQWGQMMSNLCFNLAQNKAYDPAHRQSMADCREGWEKIRTVRL
jgi:hypothetical protein